MRTQIEKISMISVQEWHSQIEKISMIICQASCSVISTNNIVNIMKQVCLTNDYDSQGFVGFMCL